MPIDTPKDEPVEVVTLVSLADGAALELFQKAWEGLLRNVKDPNTEARAARKVNVEVTVVPDEERAMGAIKLTVTSKLPGVKGVRTQVYMGVHKGEFVATEFNPKQASLFDGREKGVASVHAIDGGKK